MFLVNCKLYIVDTFYVILAYFCSRVVVKRQWVVSYAILAHFPTFDRLPIQWRLIEVGKYLNCIVLRSMEKINLKMVL